MPMSRVAVIGSGPSGVYTADELTKQGDIAVDVLDRLPCPYGLLRYGVAPDHLKMKNLEATLRKVLDTEQVRFLGGVELGRHIDASGLAEYYDAVVYAVGSAVDRRLGIPGEDLPGSFSATEFVAWYCGHPDTAVDEFTLDAHSVVVVGVGNVAVDVARILAKTPADLQITDIHDPVMEVLGRSAISDIHVLGRRGPAQAKFTTKELRELGELANADIVVREDELVLDEASEQTVDADKAVRRNLDVLREWATRTPEGKPRRIHMRFLLSPTEVHGEQAVSGVRLERNELNGSGGVRGTGEHVELPAQMLLRSVGYRGAPLPGVPFDERAGTIPHTDGRVLRDGSPAPGEYVVGWIKRGPTGVIGTNKSDAKGTVASIVADLDSLPRAENRDPDAIVARLRDAGARVVTWEGWQAIDRAEAALGEAVGRTRIKIATTEDLYAAADAISEAAAGST